MATYAYAHHVLPVFFLVYFRMTFSEAIELYQKCSVRYSVPQLHTIISMLITSCDASWLGVKTGMVRVWVVGKTVISC